MKNVTFSFVAIVAVLFIISADIARSQTFIDQWGALGRYGWPIINSQTAGNAGMGGTGSTPSGAWATLRGEFAPLTATTEQAIVVTGQLEFVGGDPTSWSAIRYGIFRHDSVGTLQYAGTDSARFGTILYEGTDSARFVSGHQDDCYGYMFSPHSGTNDQVGGNGGNGTQWLINGGGYVSTYGGGTVSLGVINQAPARAQLTAGTYNWAFSVQPLGDGTNELRWFLEKEDNSYWFGGTVIDTSGVSDNFNGIIFAINNGNGIEETGLTGLNIIAAKVDLGYPIVVPPAPWQAYYIDTWGALGRYGWPILNDSATVIGDAGMGGTGSAPSGNWATLRGEFRGNVTATTEQAIVVTGQLEFVGGDPTSWSAIRYGIFRHDSVGTLQYANTDSARFGTVQYAGTDSARFTSGHQDDCYGYMFSPHSGTNDQVGGNGGNGTQWLINGGGYVSTYGGGTVSLGVINQAPARAQLTAGTYNWAFSVQPLGDGTNELRWFVEKEDNSYWFGGTVIDTSGVSDSFNGIIFAINNGNGIAETGLTGLNIIAAKVDIGAPIVVPPAPWQPYYIDTWGALGRYGWPILNDSATVVGDAGMGGTGSAPSGNWATLRGEFRGNVTATTEQAIVVTGQLEFVGGDPTSWSAIRYGIFRHDSVGTLQYANTDSARFGTVQYAGTDSARFTSGHQDDCYGYMFSPHSGTNDQVGGNGGNGTQWLINGGGYVSTYGGGTVSLGVINQAPARAQLTAGIYNWAFSIRPLGDGTNELKWFVEKEDSSYWFGGTVIDTSGVSDNFNGIIFAINNGSGIAETGLTGLNIIAAKVDIGAPIVVPMPPWGSYYIDAWGFYGGRTGNWSFTTGDQVGNTAMNGTAPNTDWAVLRGGFIDGVEPPLDKSLEVTGKITFVDGGFEGWSGLRYGLFYSENPGSVVEDNNDSTTTHWNGTGDNNSGYLFLPPSGTNDIPVWSAVGGTGTWGAVLNTTWLNTGGADNYVLGNELQVPENAVAGPGTYDFAIYVQRLENGGNAVKFSLTNEDGSYSIEGLKTDNHNVIPTNIFNGVIFGLNNWEGSTTTAVRLSDVKVDLSDVIVSVEDPGDGSIPTQYALNQNYPNPFNPTTIIEFALPQSSNVNLVVYDILGRVVTELAAGNFNAGYHKIDFNASNLASGVYFYSLKAGDFVSVKKLMLLK